MSSGWQPDFSWMGQMPGMNYLLGGGIGAAGGQYDPTQYTAGHQQTLQDLLGGSQDYNLSSPGKYFNPMQEQTRMASKGAKTKAIGQMKAAEGAGFDPAASAYMSSLFDVMPGQQAPQNMLAAGQLSMQENAPLIAANTAMRQAASQGLTSLAALNQQSVADMMGLKMQTQNQAQIAAMQAMTNLAGQQMGMYSSMMPNYSLKQGQQTWSGKFPIGSNPWDWWTGGQYQGGFGSGGPNY